MVTTLLLIHCISVSVADLGCWVQSFLTAGTHKIILLLVGIAFYTQF